MIGWILAVLLCAPVAVAAAPLDDALALLASYHQDPAKLDRARDLLETELARDPQVATMLALARVYFTIGDVRAATVEAKLHAYDRGRAVASRAAELAPRNPDAHYLYGANTGRWGQTKGVLRSLFLLPTMNREIAAIFALNPDHAPGHALAGNMYLELPGIAGGSVEKAEEHFRQGLKVAPRYTSIRVLLARALIRTGRHAEARRELEAVLAETAPVSVADWTVKDVPRARQLLDEIKDRP